MAKKPTSQYKKKFCFVIPTNSFFATIKFNLVFLKFQLQNDWYEL